MDETNKYLQFAVIMDVSGNVNADESLGTRITIKKFITPDGIFPFVSSRAIKRGIRYALQERGFNIDPYFTASGAGGDKQKGDSGNVVEYIDQDLFGFLLPKDESKKRKAPVEISYLVSEEPIPTKPEFAARFPQNDNPIPFEIEQAKYVGKFFGNIYNYIGIFNEIELPEEVKEKIPTKTIVKGDNNAVYYLDNTERERRLKTLLYILLKGEWKFPRSSNQLNTGSYKYVILLVSRYLKPLSAYVETLRRNERVVEIEERREGNKIIQVVSEKKLSGRSLNIEKIFDLANQLEDDEKIYIIDFVGDLKAKTSDGKVEILKPSELTEKKLIKIIKESNFEINDDSDFKKKFYYYVRQGITYKKSKNKNKEREG